MRKITIVAAIFIFFVTVATLSAVENKVINFSIHLPEGTVVFKTTFVLMEEAFKRVGFDYNQRSYPGKRALISSNSGQTDGEAHRIFGIIDNDKYPNLVRIPEIQQIIFNYAYATRNINLDNGWEDLGKYNVAVLRGSAHLTDMANKYAKNTQELSTSIQLLKFLDAGRADIALFNPDGVGLILKLEEFKNSKIRKIGPPLSALPIYSYLHKKHSKLALEVAKALHAMKVDGTYQKLIKSVHK